MTRVDLLIVNARVWSEGGVLPATDAIALGEGRVVALGTARELEAPTGKATQRLDAEGGTVTPGITDAHLHLVQWARSRSELLLEGATSARDVADRLARYLAERPGKAAVVGRGWSAEGWSEPPHRLVLDKIASDRPVLLHGRDFHSIWVNGVALQRAGVSRSTPDPQGGRFERDASGEPSGVAREHAVRAFAGLVPVRDLEADLASVRGAVEALHRWGITAVHDFEGPDEERVLRALSREGPAPIRVLMHLRRDRLDEALAERVQSGAGDDNFRIGALKLFADGTLGSRTAAVLESYDGTTQQGMDLIPPAELRELVGRALTGGLSVAIHAIGDRAVRSALDAFAAAGVEAIRKVALPPRIEHVQLLDPADRPRFAALGVAASMQPVHCTSDLDLAQRYWSGRLANTYPWRALLDDGARLAFGSDAPVESPSVAHGLHAAVTRQRRNGTPEGGFVSAQRIDLDAALTAYTEGPARLAGSWPRLGRLAHGCLGDVVVWNTDLHRTDPSRLHEVEPLATVLHGKVVFRQDASRSHSSAGGAAVGS